MEKELKTKIEDTIAHEWSTVYGDEWLSKSCYSGGYEPNMYVSQNETTGKISVCFTGCRKEWFVPVYESRKYAVERFKRMLARALGAEITGLKVKGDVCKIKWENNDKYLAVKSFEFKMKQF